MVSNISFLMAQTNLVSASVRAVRSANKFIPRRAAINLVSRRYSVDYHSIYSPENILST